MVGIALASIVGLIIVVVNQSSGSNISGGATETSTNTAGAACGTVDLAINPWVGYEADAAVYSYVAKTKLNCTVVNKDLKEQVAWYGSRTS